MKLNKNWVIAAVAGVLVPAAVAFAGYQYLASPSTVLNCAVDWSCPVTVEAQQMSQTGDANGANGEESFGANSFEVSRWISGEFTDDLAVLDTFSVVGTSTLTGYVSTTRLTGEAYGAFVGSASSQTLCAIRNSGSYDRILDKATLAYNTSSATGGVYNLTVSLSATQGATGTGTNLLFSNSLEAPTSGVLNLTTTSTLDAVYVSSTVGTAAHMGAVAGGSIVWTKNTWLNFLVGSPTTTILGDCRASYR